MKLKDLIAELSKLEVECGGDIEVRVQADHGQTLMKVTHCGKGWIEEDSYVPEEIAEEDILSGDCEGIMVIDIQGY